jgi:hypothetical protein
MPPILPGSLDDVIKSLAIAVVVVALCGCGSSDKKPAAAATTPAATSNGARVIDGIRCQPEHLESHYHAHLTLLRDGRKVTVPAFIGIDQQHQCLYWLHTHDTSGIVHIESPDARTYTLGQFFDIWGRPLSATRAGPLRGDLKVFVGTKRISGDPSRLVLHAHDVITIEQGREVPPPPYRFEPGV